MPHQVMTQLVPVVVIQTRVERSTHSRKRRVQNITGNLRKALALDAAGDVSVCLMFPYHHHCPLLLSLRESLISVGFVA